MSECTSCGYINRPGIRFCESCGNSLPQPLPQASLESAGFCPACGAAARVGIRYCESCGASLVIPGQAATRTQLSSIPSIPSNQPAPVYHQPSPAGVKRPRKINIGLLLFGIIGGGVGVLFIAIAAIWLLRSQLSGLADRFLVVDNPSSGNPPSGGQPGQPADNPPASAAISVSGAAQSNGFVFTLTGFTPNSEVTVGAGEPGGTYFSKLGVATVDSNGNASGVLPVCDTIPSGDYEFLASSSAGDSASTVMTIECAGVAAQPPPPPDQSNPPPQSGLPVSPADVPSAPPVDVQPPAKPVVTVLPYRGWNGSHHSIFLYNFHPQETVTLRAFNDTTMEILVDTTVRVNNSGSAELSMDIGKDYTAGVFQLWASGQTGTFAEFPFWLGAGGNCQVFDVDCDGINDGDELWLAQKFIPLYIYDEQEPIRRDAIRFVYQVTPDPAGDGVVVVVLALYQNDWVQLSEASGFRWWHYGDTEALYLYLDVRYGLDTQGTGRRVSEAAVNRVKVKRHSETAWYYPSELEWSDQRPVFYISGGKHAAYSSSEECHNAFVYEISIPIIDVKTGTGLMEDCNGGFQITPDWVTAAYNVGEVDYPNFEMTDERSDLGQLFPNEHIWDTPDQKYEFCGGYAVPLNQRDDTQSPLGQPLCSGSIGSKWLP